MVLLNAISGRPRAIKTGMHAAVLLNCGKVFPLREDFFCAFLIGYKEIPEGTYRRLILLGSV